MSTYSKNDFYRVLDATNPFTYLQSVGKSEKSSRYKQLQHHAAIINNGNSEQAVWEFLHHSNLGKKILADLNETDNGSVILLIMFIFFKRKN
jgi:hypothetical protein